MNKTLAMIAIILGLLTVFIIAENTNDSDGSGSGGTEYYYEINGLKYWSICDSDVHTFNDRTLLCENVYIGEGTVRKNAFLDCTKLERVVCSPAVTAIGESAFKGCTNLIRISMSGVKTIGDFAFMDSSVSEVVTGSKLTSIGAYAFANCKNLSTSVLADTKVTALEAGTFYNSRILAEDIRNVDTIDGTAFLDADIRFLAMKTGQVLYNDTPTRIFDDDVLFTEFTYVSDEDGEGVKFRVGDYAVMDPRGMGGEPIPAVFLSETVKNKQHTYSKIILSEGQDCIVSTGYLTIHFQQPLCIADASVKTGDSEYIMPDAPGMGDLEFLGWNIPGIDGFVTSLTPEAIAGLWPLAEPLASYSSSTVTFDHSQLDAPSASALSVSMEFTFGSTYPVLGNIGNMGFACWIVDGQIFDGGDEITIFSEHTARSVWAEEGMFTLTVHDCSAEIYSVMEILCTSAVELGSIVFEEPADRMLVGWSLTDGGDRIRTETLRLVSDTDIYPLTKNRTKYTVTYMDGFSTIGKQTFYEGKTSAVDVELPLKPGMRFVRWMCEGTAYKMGDVLEISRNMTFYSEWESLPEYTVSYEVEPRKEISVSEGSEISIGAENSPPMHKCLSGWMETGIDERLYADGERFIVDRDISFTPVWADCPQYLMRFHDYEGRVTESSAYSDENVTLGAPERRAGYTFSGWGIREGGAPDYSPGDALRLQNDTDLFEIWIENGKFMVTIHDGMSAPYTAYLGEIVRVTLPVIDREGYVLLGWSASEQSDDPEYDTLQTLDLTDNADLYPVWERLMLLTYHCGDDVSTEYHRKGAAVELMIPAHTNCTFKGWSREPDGIPEEEYILTLMEDVDLYAVWAYDDESDDGGGSQEPETNDEPDTENEPKILEEPEQTHTRVGVGVLEGASIAVAALIATLSVYIIRRN